MTTQFDATENDDVTNNIYLDKKPKELIGRTSFMEVRVNHDIQLSKAYGSLKFFFYNWPISIRDKILKFKALMMTHYTFSLLKDYLMIMEKLDYDCIEIQQ